jgi:nicotinamidase-related amidase
VLGVTTVVVIGCNFPNCPRTSIVEASERDLRVVAVEDALSRFTDRDAVELHDIGVAVMSSAQVVRRVLDRSGVRASGFAKTV